MQRPKQTGQSGLGAWKVADVVKRTADYYRHLGRLKPSLLPSTRPHSAVGVRTKLLAMQ